MEVLNHDQFAPPEDWHDRLDWTKTVSGVIFDFLLLCQVPVAKVQDRVPIYPWTSAVKGPWLHIYNDVNSIEPIEIDQLRRLLPKIIDSVRSLVQDIQELGAQVSAHDPLLIDEARFTAEVNGIMIRTTHSSLLPWQLFVRSEAMMHIGPRPGVHDGPMRDINIPKFDANDAEVATTKQRIQRSIHSHDQKPQVFFCHGFPHDRRFQLLMHHLDDVTW
jgi:hypothetical protein